MSQIKSPFLVHQNFLPIKLCTRLNSKFVEADDGLSLDTVDDVEVDWYTEQLQAQIKAYYQSPVSKSIVTMESRTSVAASEYVCESCVLKNKIWYRNKDIDFVTVIFLKDSLASVKESLDYDFEVYGGKLEFASFRFGFTPEMGTAITYPAVPNFINAISAVKLGYHSILRIHHRSDTMFAYKPDEYRGTPDVWFKNLT